MAIVDLHVHSTGSDGARSPSWLVQEASSRGFRALSITDHDTFCGIPEAGAAAAETGLSLIPGVELSVELHCGGSAHMLGYFPSQSPETWEGGSVEQALAAVRRARDERNARIVDRLADMGVPLTMREVEEQSGGGVTGRLHIASVMVMKGAVKSTEQAFRDYLGRGAPAYVPRKRLGDYRAIDLIRENRGIPVLAHPGLLENRGETEIRALAASLRDQGLMGIEVFYPSHDGRFVGFLLETARNLGLLVTGGSDFHGVDDRDAFPPSEGGFRVDSGQVEAFLETCGSMKKEEYRNG
jgi:predicted metal-dependent phosphoesterase TrpH